MGGRYHAGLDLERRHQNKLRAQDKAREPQMRLFDLENRLYVAQQFLNAVPVAEFIKANVSLHMPAGEAPVAVVRPDFSQPTASDIRRERAIEALAAAVGGWWRTKAMKRKLAEQLYEASRAALCDDPPPAADTEPVVVPPPAERYAEEEAEAVAAAFAAHEAKDDAKLDRAARRRAEREADKAAQPDVLQ
jgi:hypothetical protein